MLQLFTIFHLNLAYSSIDEANRPDVVARCYWPLLKLIERTGAPVGVEATGFTLEAIAAIDPDWLRTLRALLDGGRCEFIGSGHAQIIGPLVPSAVNAANLRLGHADYVRFLGRRPRLGFVNEQAYSAGLIQHYRDAGFDAIVMEWDNPARAHPEWDPEWRYYPQSATGQHGESIPLLWNKAIAFQQFQRYAHDETTLEEYLAYLGGHASDAPRALALYGNDAEVFDFRPGRYQTEAALAGGEWTRIERLFVALQADPRFSLILPSDALRLMDQPKAARALHLETAADPTPVKKQRKYNITRWAVTGRDDLGINTACWRRYAAVASDPAATDVEWRDLCELWASDFRTHITDARWTAYQERLAAVDRAPAAHGSTRKGVALNADDPAASRDGTFLTLAHGSVTLVVNCRRGLAIHALSFARCGNTPVCGTLPHGFYDDIHRAADFYTGMTVMESPGRPKVTDLARVEPAVVRDDDGAIAVEGTIQTELGPVVKRLRIVDDAVELTWRLEWPERPIGSLRLGDITLQPQAFDRSTLFYRCHNGGATPDTFPLDGTRVAHGDAVSFLVSASHAIGITEGVVELGDRSKTLRIEVDKTLAALVGMITYEPIGDSYFCRLTFSAAEVDETAKKSAARHEPLVCRLRITASGW